MSSSFLIEKEIQDNIAFIKLIGSIDANTFEKFDDLMEDLFRKLYYNLIIDFSEVNFINSTGAGVMLYCYKTTSDHNGKVIILAPSETVREVFDLLTMDVFFTYCNTKEEALKLFKGN